MSGRVDLRGPRQWVMQAALLPLWPCSAVLVSPPALHFIHFLPMLEPLFDRTLCLILEEKWGKDACSAVLEQTMRTVTSKKDREG